MLVVSFNFLALPNKTISQISFFKSFFQLHISIQQLPLHCNAHNPLLYHRVSPHPTEGDNRQSDLLTSSQFFTLCQTQMPTFAVPLISFSQVVLIVSDQLRVSSHPVGAFHSIWPLKTTNSSVYLIRPVGAFQFHLNIFVEVL